MRNNSNEIRFTCRNEWKRNAAWFQQKSSFLWCQYVYDFILERRRIREEKKFSELNIEKGWEYMKAHVLMSLSSIGSLYYQSWQCGKARDFWISSGVPYFGNRPEQKALGSKVLVLHPGAHVGEGEEIGRRQIIKVWMKCWQKIRMFLYHLRRWLEKAVRLDEVLRTARIYDGVVYNDSWEFALILVMSMTAAMISWMTMNGGDGRVWPNHWKKSNHVFQFEWFQKSKRCWERPAWKYRLRQYRFWSFAPVLMDENFKEIPKI